MNNQKNLQDYLPLYFGSTVATKKGLMIINPGSLPELILASLNGEFMEMHLYSLDSIPESEEDELERLIPDYDGIDREMEDAKAIIPMAEFINQLRARHYDCDGLIDAGLAINARNL